MATERRLSPPLLLLTLLAALATSAAAADPACPAPCACAAGTDGGKVIDCSQRRLSTLPRTPRSTLTLDLSHNLLGPVINASFTSHMSDLTSLDLSHNGITSLLACTLGGMLGLRRLSLRGNHLQTIPGSFFDDNGGLRELDLSYNQLTYSELDFAFLNNLEHLRSLDVSHNRLTVLRMGPRFQVPRELEFLDLSHNEFQQIPEDAFQSTTAWQRSTKRTLRLSRCGLRSIASGSLGKIPSLHGLDLSGNPGMSADNLTQVLGEVEADIRELEVLSLAHMGISNVAQLFSQLTQVALKRLDLSNNSIAALPQNALATQSSLRVLDMSRNALTSLTAGFGKLTNLEVLNLSHNALESFKGRPTRQMAKLHTLRLSHNRLPGRDSVRVSSLTGLRHLVIDHNLLTAVPLPTNTSALVTLDLHANRIEEFSALADARKLEYVDLSDNELTTLGPELFAGGYEIKLVNLSRNSVTLLHKRAFLPHSPLVVDLSHNLLTDLDPPSWVATQTLSLANNQLATLNLHTFYGMTGLVSLNVSGNKLSWLHEDLFEHLDAVVSLDLSHNEIGGQNREGPHEKILWSKLFRNLGLLKRLDLGHNNISRMEQDALKPMESLEVLLLDNNKLATVFPAIFLDNIKLVALDLSRNPYHCSCDLLAFRDWLPRTKVPVLGIEVVGPNASYTCATPESRQGLHVTGWSLEEFECNYSTFYLIVFGSLGVLVLLLVVAGSGALRIYRRRKAKREERRRRRARILRELEQVHMGKYGSEREAELVMVSREIAEEIEDALERKKGEKRKKQADSRRHGGGYIPWPVGGKKGYRPVDDAYRDSADDDDDRGKKRRDESEAANGSASSPHPEVTSEDWGRPRQEGHLRSHERLARGRDHPRVVKLDQHYPYIVREALPVAERVEWVPRHGYPHHEDRYRYRPEPQHKRGQPHFVTYNRESIDSTGRPVIWTAANDYRPVKYWTLPSQRSREEVGYPDDLKVHSHRGEHYYPGGRPRGPGVVRFEERGDSREQPRPGSYDYWRHQRQGHRSLSQSYLPGEPSGEERRAAPPGEGERRDRAQRQYESIEQQHRGRDGLGQRSTSQPALAHGNTSGWL